MDILKKGQVQGEAAGEQTGMRQVVLQFECSSRSPGSLPEAQSARPRPLGVSDSDELERGLRICILTVSLLGDTEAANPSSPL